MFLLKLIFLIIVAPVAVLFLMGCTAGFVVGVAGIIASICGFVALAIILPAVPFIAVLCVIFGLLFVIFFCFTAMMAVIWLAKTVAVFVRDLLFGRRIDDDYFDRAFRVSESVGRNEGWHFGSDPAYATSCEDMPKEAPEQKNEDGGEENV